MLIKYNVAKNILKEGRPHDMLSLKCLMTHYMVVKIRITKKVLFNFTLNSNVSYSNMVSLRVLFAQNRFYRRQITG
jgi:hypothetical protein